MTAIKNGGHVDLLFHVHVRGACVPMCPRYEVSVIKPVEEHPQLIMTPMTVTTMTHDRQFTIAQALWHLYQDEPTMVNAK